MQMLTGRMSPGQEGLVHSWQMDSTQGSRGLLVWKKQTLGAERLVLQVHEMFKLSKV